jgi:O-antigen ligase
MKTDLPIRRSFIEMTTAAFMLVFLTAATASYLLGQNALALISLAIPCAALASVRPKAAMFLYIICLFLYVRLSSGPTIILIDAVAILLFLSFATDFLLECRVRLRIPSICRYYIILFFAVLTASLFAYSHVHAITPLVRVIIQLLIVIVFYNMVKAEDVTPLIKTYFWVAAAQSSYNLILFLLEGGHDRIFGFAGSYFDDLAMLAAPIGLAFFLWAGTRRQAVLYGFGTILAFLGLVATQSRGTMLTFIMVGVIVVIFSLRRARKMNLPWIRRRVRVLLFGAVAAAGILLLFLGFFSTLYERFSEIGETSHGTIWLRLFLWRTSLHAFLENPLTGIGPGNFRYVETIFPVLRFEAARLYVPGFSAHNLFLHYLAETGVTGTTMLVLLFFKNFSTSFKIARFSKPASMDSPAIALFGIGLTMFVSIFYLDGWMWGPNAYVAPFFVALTSKLASSIPRET